MDLRCAAGIGTILFCFMNVPVQAGTIVVDDGAECPHPDATSIQAAVAIAAPGDKILVCPGVYEETVLVDKPDLRIEAQGAPGEVVLQAPTAATPYGFNLRNTSGVLVQGFTVQGFADANIIIAGGQGNTLRKNVTTAGGADGIEVMNSAANVIEHNTASANLGPRSDGMFVHQGSSENIIRHNEVFDNRLNGINVNGAGSGNIVSGNRVSGNQQRGIQNLSSNGNIFENNHVFANNSGMFVSLNSNFVTVSNNRFEKNVIDGIRLTGGAGPTPGLSTNNLIEKNELFQNGGSAIQLNNTAVANIIRLNLVRSSVVDGIRVNDAASIGNTIERNVMRENVEHDAHDNSAGPGTGGTANFWINNKCETDNRAGLLCEDR